MPFADQRSAIARVLQDRRQGRMIRRPADLPWGACAQRLLEPYRQPVLVTPGNQRYARSRAYRRIRISLREAHAFRSDAVGYGVVINLVGRKFPYPRDFKCSRQNYRLSTVLSLFPAAIARCFSLYFERGNEAKRGFPRPRPGAWL